jgi:hypothetical protein
VTYESAKLGHLAINVIDLPITANDRR